MLVTGARGHPGRKTLLDLLERRSADGLAALVRDPAKAQDLARKGMELRPADSLDPAPWQARKADEQDMVVLAVAWARLQYAAMFVTD